MRRTICEREAKTLQAIRMNREDAALLQHLSDCRVCREAAEVAVWFERVAAEPLEAPPLREASHVWWKAELARRLDAPRRAAEPLIVAGRVQAGVTLAGILALFAYGRAELWSGQYWLMGVDLIAISAMVGPIILLSAAAMAAWKLLVMR